MLMLMVIEDSDLLMLLYDVIPPAGKLDKGQTIVNMVEI